MQSELLLQNQKLVHFILQKYNIRPPVPLDYEDLVQIGMIGLWKAFQTYIPSKSSFSTYATRVIRSELYKELRQPQYKMKYKSINETVSKDEESESELGDLIPSPECIENTVVAREVLANCLREEPELTKLAANGYTQKQIGEKLGYSQAHINRRLQKLRRKVFN